AEYAIQTLLAAARGGAEAVVLCDTNGGTLPWDIEARVREVVARVSVAVGIHAHNDAACAVANSVAAVRAGATHVQGTINGYGDHPDPRAEARSAMHPRRLPPEPREGRALRRRDREPRVRRARALRREERLRAQGRRSRRGDPPLGALVRARRSSAGREPNAR